MPLSAEEISKRYESTCKRIQDSILVMESCLGRNSKYDFDFNKVIGNLQQTNTQEEKCACIPFTYDYDIVWSFICWYKHIFIM